MSSKHRDLVRSQLEKHLNLLDQHIKPIIEPPTAADTRTPDIGSERNRSVSHDGDRPKPQVENGQTQTAPFDDIAFDTNSPSSPAKDAASAHDPEHLNGRHRASLVADVLGQLARGISSFGLSESSVSPRQPTGWGWNDDDDVEQPSDEHALLSAGEDDQDQRNEESLNTVEKVPQPLEAVVADMDGANDPIDCPMTSPDKPSNSQFTSIVSNPNDFLPIDPPNGIQTSPIPLTRPSPTHHHQDLTPPSPASPHTPIPSPIRKPPTITPTDIHNFHLHHKAIKRMLDGLDKNAQAADEANEAKRLARYLKFDIPTGPWSDATPAENDDAGRKGSKLRHGCTPADLEWEEWAGRVAWMQFMGVEYRRDDEGRRVFRL
ncbi:hypothetical protein B0T19DRAFT_400893 [Cercophora scortea]|uniref:Uncharacterized protein n=1 Tax=Cercophora scortea TaxID=314031 RepID=A0AAE0MDV3_9PEZI|nr:hypothetical protein B0T19DRAFT_400893 [Cercophora scortea]